MVSEEEATPQSQPDPMVLEGRPKLRAFMLSLFQNKCSGRGKAALRDNISERQQALQGCAESEEPRVLRNHNTSGAWEEIQGRIHSGIATSPPVGREWVFLGREGSRSPSRQLQEIMTGVSMGRQVLALISYKLFVTGPKGHICFTPFSHLGTSPLPSSSSSSSLGLKQLSGSRLHSHSASSRLSHFLQHTQPESELPFLPAFAQAFAQHNSIQAIGYWRTAELLPWQRCPGPLWLP